ncbi:MAG: DUF2723 domain-containing protein [Bacteroidales bacterium]|nr:DUF2723 domain-containing protein [Bacteroidales bacterium]
MKRYKKLNNIIGWAVFLIAAVVYISTCEPTASFWDCGEYISTAYKLQVGHPPGAPFFQLLGRFFSLFAFGNVKHVAIMINIMSALCSAFTILFLFWTITALSKKIILKEKEYTKGRVIAVLGSGVVGALAYTFSDSFWFSAVEGEVYAMSSFFTAVVFWAILKWESSADDKYSDRWIVLIAYLVGLSIGVHLLNLLAIPAITFVYYFKKTEKPNAWGIIKTFIISILILAGVMYIIIPWIVKLSGYFDLFFVNILRLPFNSGTIIYFILLIGLIVWLLYFSHKHKKYILNLITISFIFILIGYSSFIMLVIRANANTPINENNPDNAINLLSYLNREQYGDWPLLYGQYYNAPVIEYKDGTPVYSKDVKAKKYVVTDDRKFTIPKYDPRFETIFPRMWNNTQQSYVSNYKKWADVKGHPVYNPDGTPVKDSKGEIIYKPTFLENLNFFFSYQLNYMYFRYFMWNFAGRQNDIQGFGDNLDGNWISGINFIDEMRLGPQDNIPDSRKNKGNNKFYFLPLILGLTGLFYHANKSSKDCFIVFLLFFMTGIAIVIYLNQYAFQPRERDYAYAASFYAFSIWIGLGVLSIFEKLSKKIKPEYSAVIVSGLCLLLVPGIMAQQGWDDHDRSGKYTCVDFASNYLNSCEKNAILFTNGDNDTFPLWYAQEVEGIRTDVRIVNLSLLSGDWYINQLRKKVYDADAVPFTLDKKNYRAGNRDVIYLIEKENIKDYVDVKDILRIIKKDDNMLKLNTEYGKLDYFPTKKFSISVDSAKVVDNKTVSKADADKIVKTVDWKINRNAIQKSELMVLDFLATNEWERPVYFAVTTGKDSYLGLSDYFQLEGLAYRLVPIKTSKSIDGQIGRINTSVMYDNLMNKFKWGGIKNPDVYIDETTRRMSMNFRNNFARLANALVYENKNDSAVKVCDRCLEVIPDEKITYNYFSLPFVEIYYKAGAKDKADALVKRLIEINDQDLNYYFSFKDNKADLVFNEKQQNLAILQRINQITKAYNKKLAEESEEVFNKYYSYLINTIH